MTTFDEYLARLSEERRRKIEEGTKALMAEMEFWNSLPEAEKNKRLEAPKVSYDAETDVLWLKNGRPTPRSCEIVKNRVTGYFEAKIWYPSAVRILGAYELLGQFFRPDHAPASDSLIIQYGEEGEIERSLKLENLEVQHKNLSDYLWIGNGERPWDGAEIAEDLIVSYAENSNIPVGVALFKAAELLTPILSEAAASNAARLV